MLIKESTLRRIIREEFAKSINEADAVQPGAPGPTDTPQVAAVQADLNKIMKAQGSNSSVVSAVNNFRANMANKPFADAVAQSIGNAEKASAAPAGTLRAALASMATKDVQQAGAGGPMGAGDTPYNTALGLTSVGSVDKVKAFDDSIKAVDATQFIVNVKAWVQSVTVAANNAATNKGTAAGTPAGAVQQTHTVKSGETIAKIAQQHYDMPPSKASMASYEQLAATIKPASGPKRTASYIQAGDVITLPTTLENIPLKR